MNRPTKIERRMNLLNRLAALGFTFDESQQLRRIEMTLSRWSEEECNGTIQRDGDEGDGKPRRYWENQYGEHRKGSIIPDREKGALKRLGKLLEAKPELVSYHQSDPRGCSLYIVRKTDLNGHDINSTYTRGLAVCD